MDATTGVRGRPGRPDDAPAARSDAVAPVIDPFDQADPAAPPPVTGPGDAEIGAEETRFAEFVLGAVRCWRSRFLAPPAASSWGRSPSWRSSG